MSRFFATTIALPLMLISLASTPAKAGVNQKDRASEWKCQPNYWLSTQLLIHEIVVGFFALNMGSFISTGMACWVKNGGWSMVYYDPAEYGYGWLFLQIPITFIWQVN